MATTTVENGNHTQLRGQDDRVMPRPPRRPLTSRVPPSLALAVVAGLLAGLFFLRGTGSSDGVAVAVAGRDIPAGEEVTVGDLRFTEVAASSRFVAQLVPRRQLGSLEGSIAIRGIVEGSPLLRDDLVSPAAGGLQRAMSLPIEREHAVGGALRPGDRVDVIDGVDASYVITNAEVLAVPKAVSDALSGARSYAITIAVDAQGALRLAAAIAGGKVEVVRSTGAEPLPAPTDEPISASGS